VRVTILVEQKNETVPEAVERWLEALLESDYTPEVCYVGPDDLEIHDIVTLHDLACELLEEARDNPDDPHIPAPSSEVLAWLSEQIALIDRDNRGRLLWVVR